MAKLALFYKCLKTLKPCHQSLIVQVKLELLILKFKKKKLILKIFFLSVMQTARYQKNGIMST
jgi:hypothetical protein